MALKRSLRTAALVTAVGAAALAAPSAASAAKYTPQQICGSGYQTISSFNLPGSTSTVYLTYNNSTGKNCVTTLKHSYIGTNTDTGAYITYGDGSGRKEDRGNFGAYAGPVYLSAAGQCIYYGGLDYNSGGWWGMGPSWCS